MAELRTAMDDWTEPGPFELASGVHRIPLSLPIDGLSTVNSYLFAEGDDLVLVDPGWARTETDLELEAALAALGHHLRDVTKIIVSHHHWDHYTEAIQLRHRYGTPISLGRDEHFSVESYPDDDLFYPVQIALLLKAGAPLLAREIEQYKLEDYEIGMENGDPDEWLTNGDAVQVGSRVLEVIHTPGHTRGSVVYADRENQLLVTGDHILPKITPSFGLEYAPEPFPLRSFLGSLRLMKSLPDGWVLPAHGAVTPSAHTRVDELLAHHEERLNVVAEVLSAGAETAFDVARGMTWTRRERALDELAPIHRMTAVNEISAHLDLLFDRNRVARHTDAGVDRYVLQ